MDVINRSVEVVGKPIFTRPVCGVLGSAREVEARVMFGFQPVNVTNRLYDFCCEEGCHSTIQGFSQVGCPFILGGDGMQKLSCV